MEKWENYWKKKRESRRHPTMQYFEKNAVMKEYNKQLDDDEYRAKAKRLRKKKLHQQILRKRHQEFRDYVARVDRERHEKDVADRTRNFHALKLRMGMFEQWGIENETRDAKNKKAFDESERKRLQKEAEDNRKNKADALEAKLEKERLDGLKLTQDTLTIMRRAGTIAANHDETKHIPPPMVPQRETAESVTLVVRPSTPEPVDEDGNVIVKKKAKKKSKRQRQFFTAELKRFRNVIEMRGEQIGEKGGVALGRELIAGVCPRMQKLDLSWNLLKFQGASTLFDAFARGAATGIIYLDLRANHIDERGVAGLKTAMEKGALPNMSSLDLRQNSFGDGGAKVLAHLILSGVLGNVEILRCDACQIRDTGISALYKAASAKSIVYLMPHLKYISVKNNHPSKKCMDHMDMIPKHFMI
jgi:hypothetical protein